MASEDLILDTNLSIDYVKSKLLEAEPWKSKLKEEKPELQSYTAELLAEQQGFGAYIIKLVLKWKKSEHLLPESMVIKCPTVTKWDKLSEEMLPGVNPKIDMMKAVIQMTKTECNFYGLWNESNPCPIGIPRVHFMEPDPLKGMVLALEDLSNKFSQQTIGHGLTFKQLMQVTESLANLHAWCFTHSGWEDKFPRMPKDIMAQYVKSVGAMYDKVCKDFPGVFNPKKIEAIRKHYTTVDDLYFMMTLHEKLNIPPVLWHGDLWVGNLMFKPAADKNGKTYPSDDLLAIFDWQTCQPGCPSNDFVRLSCTSISASMRRERMKDVLKHYYDTLKQKLGKEPPFSFDVLLNGYNTEEFFC